MKRFGIARILTAAFALSALTPLAHSGCGDKTPDAPPADISGLKTPSDVLKEATAKDQAVTPAAK